MEPLRIIAMFLVFSYAHGQCRVPENLGISAQVAPNNAKLTVTYCADNLGTSLGDHVCTGTYWVPPIRCLPVVTCKTPYYLHSVIPETIPVGATLEITRCDNGYTGAHRCVAWNTFQPPIGCKYVDIRPVGPVRPPPKNQGGIDPLLLLLGSGLFNNDDGGCLLPIFCNNGTGLGRRKKRFAELSEMSLNENDKSTATWDW